MSVWGQQQLAYSRRTGRGPIVRSDGTFEAGDANPDWRRLQHDSAMTTDRMRNNFAYMPRAASQVALADAAAGGVNAGNPLTDAQPVVATPKPAGSLAEKYQKAMDEHTAKTEGRYGDILSGHQDRIDTAEALLLGKGPPTAEEINLQRQRSQSDAQLARQGVANSTLAYRRNEDFKRAAEGLDFNKRLAVSSALTNLKADPLRTMENRTDVAPDMSELIALEQAKGGGNTEGMGMPAGGPPAVMGDPYGMQRPFAQQKPQKETAPAQAAGGSTPVTQNPAAFLAYAKSFGANSNRQASYAKSRERSAQGQIAARGGRPLPATPLVGNSTSASPTVRTVAPLPAIVPPLNQPLRHNYGYSPPPPVVPAPKLTYADPAVDAEQRAYYANHKTAEEMTAEQMAAITKAMKENPGKGFHIPRTPKT